MSRWGLRALPSYPWRSDTTHAAIVGVAEPMTREEAEGIRRAMPNGEHFEVVEVHHRPGNAEGCDICSQTNPPYPFLCEETS